MGRKDSKGGRWQAVAEDEADLLDNEDGEASIKQNSSLHFVDDDDDDNIDVHQPGKRDDGAPPTSAQKMAAANASGKGTANDLPTPHSPPIPRLTKFAVTGCLCLGFLALGVAAAMLGPSQKTFSVLLDVALVSISYVFTARSVGYLVGSIVSGMLFHRVDALLMLIISIGATAFGQIVAPLSINIALLGCAFTLQGLGMGFLDTAGNVMMLRLWSAEEVGPFMQSLHFSFGFGAFISPLIAQPFLISTNTTVGSPEASEAGDIKFAFWIGAIPALLTCAWGLYFFIQQRMGKNNIRSIANPPPSAHNPHSESGGVADSAFKKRIFKFKVYLLSLLFFFFMIYVGIEVAYGGYVYEYSVQSPIHFDETQAALVNSTFWGLFTFGRLLAILLAYLKISPAKLLFSDLIGVLIATLGMMIGASDNAWVLWLGSAIFGLSMASVFPSAIHLAETYVDLDGKAASVLVVGSALGEMIFPLLAGKMLETVGPNSLMILSFTGLLFASGLFIWVYVIGRTHKMSKLVMARESRMTDAEQIEFKPLAASGSGSNDDESADGNLDLSMDNVLRIDNDRDSLDD